ncbi:hypothetical protein Vadar_032554 [Vaccinium darrowii]|uniref:Uncharacterized protein n=1 Tax=Vaccinium darrowii TaxID=229202 RepID=A0ACB7YR29_9ERIC|nr:hypothetical protein Vadar_032554 [Vaccinium darrowii]
MGICKSTPTYQTSNAPVRGPVQGYSQDPFNPPLAGTSGRSRSCSSCHRPEPIEVEYADLGDGRYLCPDCLPISLMESKQLKPVIHQVHSFFEDYLKLPVRKDIPIFFVDANEMNQHSRHGTIVDLNSFQVYGSTVFSRGDVTLKIVLGETLAHEMVHALIRLQGWNFVLETSVEEGLCDAVACMWIDYTADDYDNASFAKTLNEFRKYAIEANHSDDAEFAKARRAVEKFGLKHTLKCIARTRSIPEAVGELERGSDFKVERSVVVNYSCGFAFALEPLRYRRLSPSNDFPMVVRWHLKLRRSLEALRRIGDHVLEDGLVIKAKKVAIRASKGMLDPEQKVKGEEQRMRKVDFRLIEKVMLEDH